MLKRLGVGRRSSRSLLWAQEAGSRPSTRGPTAPTSCAPNLTADPPPPLAPTAGAARSLPRPPAPPTAARAASAHVTAAARRALTSSRSPLLPAAVLRLRLGCRAPPGGLGRGPEARPGAPRWNGEWRPGTTGGGPRRPGPELGLRLRVPRSPAAGLSAHVELPGTGGSAAGFTIGRGELGAGPPPAFPPGCRSGVGAPGAAPARACLGGPCGALFLLALGRTGRPRSCPRAAQVGRLRSGLCLRGPRATPV